MLQTGECLQLDSGQGGCCSQAWTVWTNNAASGLCNDPASCCGSRQQLWSYDPLGRTLKTNTTGQCLSVHTALHNVGVAPCTPLLGGLQAWDWDATHGQFVSSATPPGAGNAKYCLARTKDVAGGALEVWGGALAGGDIAVLLFNRNAPGPANVTALWSDLGLPPAQVMKVGGGDCGLSGDCGVWQVLRLWSAMYPSVPAAPVVCRFETCGLARTSARSQAASLLRRQNTGLSCCASPLWRN